MLKSKVPPALAKHKFPGRKFKMKNQRMPANHSSFARCAIQPKMTKKGVTSSAICIELPIATPMARSILSFIATTTAVTCSAALPTMGSRMRPMKVLEIWAVQTRESIE